jgi:hypothetical protein
LGGFVNNVHDMGGMHGFGSIRPDTSARPFHSAWEGRVCAMMMAAMRRDEVVHFVVM